jgi:hypothetical protein
MAHERGGPLVVSKSGNSAFGSVETGTERPWLVEPIDAKFLDGFCDIQRRYFAWRIHSIGSITAEKNEISAGG